MPRPPPPPLLSQVLTDVVKTTTERAAEGQTLFAPIAAIWDDYLQSDTVRQLPVRLRKPLEALCKEISQTATIHFDSYIKGIRPAKTTSQPLPVSVTDEQNTQTAKLVSKSKETRTPALPTYAQMVTSIPATTPQAQPVKSKPVLKQVH